MRMSWIWTKKGECKFQTEAPKWTELENGHVHDTSFFLARILLPCKVCVNILECSTVLPEIDPSGCSQTVVLWLAKDLIYHTRLY